MKTQCSFILSVQFSHAVVSDSLQPHGLQQTRLPCPSSTPGACLNSCLLSRWCHPTISSSVVPLSSCLQSFPASGSFQWVSSSYLVAKYWIFSFSISPFNEYSGLIFFRIDWFDLVIQGTLKSPLQHHSSKASSLQHSAFFTVQLSHPYMTTGKTIALTRQTFVGKVMSLLLNMLYESEVAQSCPTLCNPMYCSLPLFSIHGIFQARVLEWVAISL